MDTAAQIYVEFTQVVHEIDLPDMQAFSIVGKEIDPMYAGATAKETVYKVASVELSEDKKTIKLTMNDSFRNAIGEITVSYDSSRGYMAGNGGVVESFSKTFIPTDLKPLYNPGTIENIKVQSTFDVVPISVRVIPTTVVERITTTSLIDCLVTRIDTKPINVVENISVRSVIDVTPTLVGSLLP